jgi:hypothetical protein
MTRHVAGITRHVRATPRQQEDHGGMTAQTETETVVLDLADVAHEIFVYNAMAVRRDVVPAELPDCPSALEYEPQLSEFTD